MIEYLPDPPSDNLTEKQRANIDQYSGRVAAYLSRFHDQLRAENFANEAATKIVVAATPVVTDMVMKGIFK